MSQITPDHAFTEVNKSIERIPVCLREAGMWSDADRLEKTFKSVTIKSRIKVLEDICNKSRRNFGTLEVDKALSAYGLLSGGDFEAAYWAAGHVGGCLGTSYYAKLVWLEKGDNYPFTRGCRRQGVAYPM